MYSQYDKSTDQGIEESANGQYHRVPAEKRQLTLGAEVRHIGVLGNERVVRFREPSGRWSRAGRSAWFESAKRSRHPENLRFSSGCESQVTSVRGRLR